MLTASACRPVPHHKNNRAALSVPHVNGCPFGEETCPPDRVLFRAAEELRRFR